MLDSTDELGGRGAKAEDLPDRSEGETERNLRISDWPKVPKLSKQEKNYMANCDRPLYMKERRKMPKELHRGTLGNMTMDYYEEEEETSEGTGETSWKAPVGSKEPPPKEPTTYWQDINVRNTADKGTGKGPNGSDSKGKDAKRKDHK